jgi:hypothetical protein
MRGFICFMSLMILWAGIETLPLWAIIVLLATFGITSKKYWVK